MLIAIQAADVPAFQLLQLCQAIEQVWVLQGMSSDYQRISSDHPLQIKHVDEETGQIKENVSN